MARTTDGCRLRQLLTESLVLAAAGGAAGLLATLVLALVRTLATPALPVHATVTLDAGARAQ